MIGGFFPERVSLTFVGEGSLANAMKDPATFIALILSPLIK